MTSVYECKSNTNIKFWSSELHDNHSIVFKYGCRGKDEKTKIKQFATKELAENYIQQQIDKKEKKGYHKVNGDETKQREQPTPTPAPTVPVKSVEPVQQKPKKKMRKCGNCGEFGHNKRTCPLVQKTPDTQSKKNPKDTQKRKEIESRMEENAQKIIESAPILVDSLFNSPKPLLRSAKFFDTTSVMPYYKREGFVCEDIELYAYLINHPDAYEEWTHGTFKDREGKKFEIVQTALTKRIHKYCKKYCVQNGDIIFTGFTSMDIEENPVCEHLYIVDMKEDNLNLHTLSAYVDHPEKFNFQVSYDSIVSTIKEFCAKEMDDENWEAECNMGYYKKFLNNEK